MIGKPYAGELHVRFDEGEQDFVSRKILNGHEAGNSGYSQGSTYQTLSLFSTLPIGPSACAGRTPWAPLFWRVRNALPLFYRKNPDRSRYSNRSKTT